MKYQTHTPPSRSVAVWSQLCERFYVSFCGALLRSFTVYVADRISAGPLSRESMNCIDSL